MEIVVKHGSLVLLSGPSGSGKSKSTADHAELTLSSDNLRLIFFGEDLCFPDGSTSHRPRPINDALIFETLLKVTESRLRAGLTTLVDATFLTDRDRESYAKLAKTLNVPFLVCIFDVDQGTLLERDKNRYYSVGSDVIARQLSKFERSSKFNYVKAEAFTFVVEKNIINDPQIDAIGDIHGCYTELLGLLAKMGYVIQNGVASHAEGRRLMFLGDYVDRGLQSLEVLKFIKTQVTEGHHYAVRGNHEENLKRILVGELVTSTATRETAHNVLQSGDTEWVINFINSLPAYYVWDSPSRLDRVVFCHADIGYFEYDMPSKHFYYGFSKVDNLYPSDQMWQANGSSTLCRGHIGSTSEEPVELVISLEKGASFGGRIGAARFVDNTVEYFVSDITEDYQKRKFSTLRAQFATIPAKYLRQTKEDHLTLYKYSPNAHYDEAWNKYPLLNKAKGLVLGLNSEPVNTVLSRVPNLSKESFAAHKKVVIAEKLNGFLVITFLDPYTKELVITSSGSFTGDFVELSKKYLYKDGLAGRILKFLNTHRDRKNLTLSWECISPEDTVVHPIEYKSEGISLIAVGSDDKIWPESEREKVAEELETKHVVWHQCIWQDAYRMSREADWEGYMVRDADSHLHVGKIKSPYYLTIKYFLRLSSKKEQQLIYNFDEFVKQMPDLGIGEGAKLLIASTYKNRLVNDTKLTLKQKRHLLVKNIDFLI